MYWRGLGKADWAGPQVQAVLRCPWDNPAYNRGDTNESRRVNICAEVKHGMKVAEIEGKDPVTRSVCRSFKLHPGTRQMEPVKMWNTPEVWKCMMVHVDAHSCSTWASYLQHMLQHNSWMQPRLQIIQPLQFIPVTSCHWPVSDIVGIYCRV